MSAQFQDGKENSALRTIGEVSKAMGIKPHVLRYWEKQFPSFSPLKRSGGRRYYRPEDIAMVRRIDQLVNDRGFTIKGARKALTQKGGEALDSGSSDSGALDSGALGKAQGSGSLGDIPLEQSTKGSADSKAGGGDSPLVDAPVAHDGGVDDFFAQDFPKAGAGASGARLAEPRADSEFMSPKSGGGIGGGETAQEASPSSLIAPSMEQSPAPAPADAAAREELLTRLRSIRSRLADALVD